MSNDNIYITEIANQIKPFLREYLEKKGIQTNKNFKCIFPDHEDTNPSCSIVQKKNETPRFWCHSCQKYGDIFDAVHFIEKKPITGIDWYNETLKYLANMFGIEIKELDLTDEQIYELDTYKAYRIAASLLTTIPPDNHIKWYEEIKKRQWNTDILAENHVGTVISYEYFRESLRSHGFTAGFLDEIDLSRKDIFAKDNIIFTWKDEKGRPVGFSCRNLNFEDQQAEALKTGKKNLSPKYNNQRTTGLKCNIFQKGKRLYGIENIKKEEGPLYIFEGQTDVLTARHNGLNKCVAIGGLSFHEDHIYLLKELKSTDIILCLDSDEAGQKKLSSLLETKFSGHKDLRIRVVVLPQNEDPDSFLRKYKLSEFKKLAHWSAFEWKLNQYSENEEEATICKQMIPLICNEISPVIREQQCKILSKRTGISYKSISSELNNLLDAKSHQRSRERQNVLDKTIYELRHSVVDAEQILQNAQASLMELSKQYNQDLLSNDEFARFIQEQKEKQENTNIKHVGFKLGPDLKELEEAFRGEWADGVFICIGGKANSGKSALLAKIACCIAQNNEDVCVLYHTIDDTAEQLLPRFVTILEGSNHLTMNMVKNPAYWSNQRQIPYLMEKREVGFSALKTMADDGKLIIKDATHGGSLPFTEHLISYYQDKFPNRKIVYILDNFHKLRDFEGKDERVRFKQISTAVDSIARKYKCCIMASVEYTKMPVGVKPTNDNISECLTGDTEIYNPEIGEYTLIKNVKVGDMVATLGKDKKIINKRVSAVLEKGIQEIYQVKTKTGRTLKTTMNHPFFGQNGWTKLSDLKLDDYIAIPRYLASNDVDYITPELARFLGYMAGDGSWNKTKRNINKTPQFTNSSIDYLDDIEGIVKNNFDVKIKRKQDHKSWTTYFSRKNGTAQKNPIILFLESIGIVNQKKDKKTIPNIIFKSSINVKANYLAGLFAADGCISRTDQRIKFSNISWNLISGCQRLLLHLGIQSYINGPKKGGLYEVFVANNFIETFKEKIPLIGYKKDILNTYKTSSCSCSYDSIPSKFHVLEEELMKGKNLTILQNYKQKIFCKKQLQNSINRETLQKISEKLNNEVLKEFAFSDIFWDRIASIESIEPELTWDLTIEGTHNFVANDIFCHNTIQIIYDAKAIIHLYNEMADKPDACKNYHEFKQLYDEAPTILPNVEFIIGKNKISDIKKSFFLKFFPASSNFESIDTKYVIEQINQTKQKNIIEKNDNEIDISDVMQF